MHFSWVIWEWMFVEGLVCFVFTSKIDFHSFSLIGDGSVGCREGFYNLCNKTYGSDRIGTWCLENLHICDGQKQCYGGEDEHIDLCKAIGTFPKAATVKCYEPYRFHNTSIEIMAIRCDGRKECRDGRDENGCDIPFSYLLYILASGFGLISIAAVILQCCHRKNRSVDEIEMAMLEPSDQPFEEWHEKEDRGKEVGFFQGSDNRRLQNQALIAFEWSFHNNYARAIVCIKVSYTWGRNVLSRWFLAGNQVNHQNVDPSLLTNKF